MGLTFREAKKLVAEYAGRGGKCPTSDEVSRFTKEVMEHLLYSGQWGSIRKFCFVAQHGCITLPPEIETPLKIRIDSQVGTVWNKFYEFYSVNCELADSLPCDKVLIDEPHYVSTVYDVDPSGSLLGVLGTCNEEEDAYVHVQGKDQLGNDIYTFDDKGDQILGEKFRIKKGQLRYGKVKFHQITNVIKSKTLGYVELWAVDPTIKAQIFLASYGPLEEKPMYKRARIQSRKCGPYTHVTMLARIRLKDNYTDNDIIPFDSTIPLKIAAQRLQAESNNDVQTANYKKEVLKEFVENEAAYKKVAPGQVIEVFAPLAGGAIKNIV
jgi:hypothetical protein